MQHRFPIGLALFVLPVVGLSRFNRDALKSKKKSQGEKPPRKRGRSGHSHSLVHVIGVTRLLLAVRQNTEHTIGAKAAATQSHQPLSTSE